MIYGYRVKRNGVYYEAGQDVPEERKETVAKSSYSAEKLDEIISPKRGRAKKAE